MFMDVVKQLNYVIRSGRVRTVLAFFSGGRDSAVSSHIAYQFAKAMGLDFKLVFIDTTIGLEETKEYVRRYAEWLGVELITLRPEKTFEEFVMLYPYWPSLQHARWCFAKLKRKPLVRYLRQFPPLTVIQVLGIRKGESLFREKEFTKIFEIYCEEDRPCQYSWFPVLHVSLNDLERYIRRYGIPRPEVWNKLGFSGECFCLAGMPKWTLDRLIQFYPYMAERLAKIDDIIHAHRRNMEPSFPPPIKHLRIRLKDYIQMKMKENEKQTTLDQYIYVGKPCDSCLFEKREGF